MVRNEINIFSTDNGDEFSSFNFEKLLERNDIVHQKTNPYAPEKLEKSFWAEAVNTAVYLRIIL